jgi:hypothetical protein
VANVVRLGIPRAVVSGMTATNLSGLTDLSTYSTTALLACLDRLESAVRLTRGSEADELCDAWLAVRRELDSRPTDAVLASL